LELEGEEWHVMTLTIYAFAIGIYYSPMLYKIPRITTWGQKTAEQLHAAN